jgi:Ca2+-binding EF-hand superfamily protein
MNKLTERKIAQLFYVIGTREQEVEKSREILSQNLDFEAYTAFKHLDRESRGSLSASDIQFFFQGFHKTFELSHIQLLISQYDKNLDGRLSLNEFINFVLPSTNEALKDSVSLRTPLPSLSLEIQYLMLHLFELEVIYHEEIEKIRCDVTIQPDFSLLDSFRTIDYLKNSVIDKAAVRRFVEIQGFYLNDLEVSGVIRRLDMDGDGAVNYLEYVDAVMPKRTRNNFFLKRYSPAKNNNEEKYSKAPLKYETVEDSYNTSSVSKYSPARQSSPLRNLRHSSPLRKSPPKELYSFKNESPTRTSSFNRINGSASYSVSSPLRQSPPRTLTTNFSPLRHPVRNSSPLRQSPPRTLTTNFTPSRHPMRNSSPLRQSPPRTLTTNFSPSRYPVRNSSPLRQSPPRTLTTNFSPSRYPVRNSSPLRQSPPRTLTTNFTPSKYLADHSPFRQSPSRVANSNYTSSVNYSSLSQPSFLKPSLSRNRHSSPLKKSPPKIFSSYTPSREQSLHSSIGLATSFKAEESPARTLNSYKISPPRNSSPLRYSPPSKYTDASQSLNKSKYSQLNSIEMSSKISPTRQSPPRSFYASNGTQDLELNMRSSPLKSLPLRNASLRESANNGFRGSSSGLNYSSSYIV